MGVLLNLYKKDMILGFKDVWIILELGASIAIAALLIFVIPKEIKNETPVYIQDQTGLFKTLISTMAGDNMESEGIMFTDAREDMIKGMKKNRNAFGLIISPDTGGRFSVELLTPPFANKAMIDYFEVEMSDIFSMLSQNPDAYSPDILQKVKVISMQSDVSEEAPFNKRIIPIILVFIVGMMGLFTMISVIGQERSDQTLRAFKVTPARLWQMLSSKHLMLLTVGLVTFTILYLFPVGFDGYLKALLIIIPTIIIGSCLGVILGSYFDNPMSAMGWVFLLMILLSLPAISLLNPVFSPEWLKLIPSYYTLFGIDAAIFPDGYSNNLWISFLVLAGIALLLIPASGFVFTRKMRKEF